MEHLDLSSNRMGRHSTPPIRDMLRLASHLQVIIDERLRQQRVFFGLNQVSPQTEDRLHTTSSEEPHGFGLEVVYFEMEWPGFVPQTSSFRRGCPIHSTTHHLAQKHKDNLIYY